MSTRTAVLVGVIALILCVSPRAVQAKDLFVDGDNSSCSDSTSYAANDAAHPWCHFLRATWGSTNRAGSCVPDQAARAGDTVYVSGGPYSAPGQDNSGYPAYLPCNDGTAANRIVFEGVTQVVLQLSSSLGPVIGGNASVGGSYTTWRNFKIDQANAPPRADSAAATAFNINGVYFEGLVIIGVEAPAWQNNHSAIRLQNGVDFVIRNCDLSNFTEIGYDGTGLTTYNAYDIVIEHNEIHGNGFGMNLKDHRSRPDGGSLVGNEGYEIIVRYNRIYDNVNTGINAYALFGPGVKTYIYQNVFVATDGQRSSNRAIRFHGFDDHQPANVSFVNNTIYGDYDYGGIYLTGGVVHFDNLVQNNIVSETPWYVYAPDVTTAGAMGSTKTDFEYNLSNSDAVCTYNYGDTQTWSDWTTATDAVRTTPLDDLGSSFGTNPRFVNATGGDFRLCRGPGVPEAACSAASPAINAGRDILDLDGDGSTTDTITLGAYITGDEVIGLGGTGGVDPGVPPGVVSGLERSDVLPGE